MPDGRPSALMLVPARPRQRRQKREPGEPIVVEVDREKHKIRMKRYHLRAKLRGQGVPEDEIDLRLAQVGLAPEVRVADGGDDDTRH